MRALLLLLIGCLPALGGTPATFSVAARPCQTADGVKVETLNQRLKCPVTATQVK
jgi:hypothetical protein